MNLRVAILTVSDSAVNGSREDLSGPALRDACQQLGWEVSGMAAVPDETHAIQGQLRCWLGRNFDLILTTGGTGMSARDVTPEATRPLLQRELPGIAELMRMKGLEQTPFAPLSRAIAGAAGNAMIVNTPGSPEAAVHSLKAVAHLVPHVVQLLRGQTEHAAGGTRRN